MTDERLGDGKDGDGENLKPGTEKAESGDVVKDEVAAPISETKVQLALAKLVDFRNEKIMRKLTELALKIRSCEIEPDCRFDVENWSRKCIYDGVEAVLTKGILGKQALILTHADYKDLDVIEIKRPNGKTTLLDPDDDIIGDDDVLIIYPWDLGD